VDRPPRITIVTPSYNQAAFVEATLRSVLLQGYPDLEYLVFDGGSTDGAADVLRRYAPHLTHLEIAKDRGQSHAINKGLERASGDVVAWLNSDDRLLPGALWAVAAAARARPEAAAWVGRVRSVTPSGRLIYEHIPRGLDLEQLADWGHAGQFAQPGCFFSRSALSRAGLANEQLHYAFDVDLFLRLARQGPFTAVEAFLAEETIHPAAKTFAQRGKSLAELHLVQNRNGIEHIAFWRLSEELQDLETLKRGTLVERVRWQAGIALRSGLDLLKRRT
jgi:glycosyltransferase involved in cell wall biosynthesis